MTDAGPRPGLIEVEMVIPLKWCGGPGEPCRVEEMTGYLDGMRRTVSGITVVDGSPEPVRRAHEAAWSRFARIVVPDAHPGGASAGSVGQADLPWGPRHVNGKVVGAVTGIRTARHENVILADDDVRHTPESITALVTALGKADLVRPVNVFDGWPWHARWDGSRTLLNVALGTDWPGTFGLRRSTILACGGWSADVLFENLELWRTVVAAGGRAIALPDVAVWRRPPDVTHFWRQRVRQAYDDFAQPGRLLAELAILPVVGLTAARSPRVLGILCGAVVLVAARGRRRLGVDRVPPSVPLWAPAWVLERGVCVWLAVYSRLTGGVRYHGGTLRMAAHSVSSLRHQISRS